MFRKSYSVILISSYSSAFLKVQSLQYLVDVSNIRIVFMTYAQTLKTSPHL